MTRAAATLARAAAALAALVALSAACASKEPSEPADIAFDVEFPSVAAAVAVDNVRMYVFEGALSWNDLVRKRQTAQGLPTAVVERAVSPCDFQRGTNNAFELKLDATFTVLAVGQAAGADLLVGCTVQTQFGATRAQPVSLTYVDASKRIPETTCPRLSDKCNGACK